MSLQLDDGSSELERRIVESHLGRCEDCRVFAADVTAFTNELRTAPLELAPRPIEIPRRRRLTTARLQIATAAAVAVAALGVGSQLASSEPEGSSFATLRPMTKYPTQSQLDRELAILERLPERAPLPAGGLAL